MLNASLVDRLTANDITIRTVTGVSNVALTVEVGHTRCFKIKILEESTKVVATKSNIKKRMNCSMPGPSKITPHKELLFVMMNLQNGISNVFISRIFDISTALCSKIVTTWIKLLSKKFTTLIFLA